jgi:membrane-bound lytic murein transglycosylase F
LASSFPDKYDNDFRSAAGRFMPGVDWRLLKSQCWQESRFKTGAISPVGAMGLCQFMPGTWNQVAGQLDFPANASAFAPELSIEAAAYYMGRLRAQWSAPRPETDRHSLALASYNGGLGNILAAQAKCQGANGYQQIIHCLPQVTGPHSRETIDYVDQVWRYFKIMLLGD